MATVNAKMQLCESIIAYTFTNKGLLCEALQTSGVGSRMKWNGTWTIVHKKNTRLAVYGDTALNMALCRLWYPMDLTKGEWTTIRNLTQNSNLADVGVEHGLDACVLLNPGTPTVSNASMAGTVEAIIGAVELDGGSEALMQVAERLGLVHPFLTPCPSISDVSLLYAWLLQYNCKLGRHLCGPAMIPVAMLIHVINN